MIDDLKEGQWLLGEDTEELPVKLTDAEKLQLGENVGHLSGQIGKQEADKKAVNDALKAEIDRLKAEQSSKISSLRSGTEIRDVTIRMIGDRKTGLVSKIRIDTGEVISTRPLTGKEMQASFDFANAGPKEEEASRQEGSHIELDGDALAAPGGDPIPESEQV